MPAAHVPHEPAAVLSALCLREHQVVLAAAERCRLVHDAHDLLERYGRLRLLLVLALPATAGPLAADGLGASAVVHPVVLAVAVVLVVIYTCARRTHDQFTSVVNGCCAAIK